MKKKDTELYTRLREGLEEGIQWARGEISLRTFGFPDPPPPLKPDEIAAIRHKHKMSQEAFAVHLGVHRTYLGGVERGERNLTLRSAERIADALRLDVHELLRS